MIAFESLLAGLAQLPFLNQKTAAETLATLCKPMQAHARGSGKKDCFFRWEVLEFVFHRKWRGTFG
jgi:hypothetical protein